MEYELSPRESGLPRQGLVYLAPYRQRERQMSDPLISSEINGADYWRAFELIDSSQFGEWTRDLEKEDVDAILSGIPAEGRMTIEAIAKSTAIGDVLAARRAAHRLKGMALNIGARRLGEIARMAEIKAINAADFVELLPVMRATLDDTLLQ